MVRRKRLLVLADQQFKAGAAIHFVKGGGPVIDDKKWSSADVVHLLQPRIDASAAVAATRAAYVKALAVEDAAYADSQADATALVQAVRAMYVKSTDTLADFGLAPKKKPRARTTEQQAVANAKAAATREARHTMGKRQKAKVKGAAQSSPATLAPSPTAASSAAPTTAT